MIISDTNILSSLAVAEAFDLLFQLFSYTQIYIPPAVYRELQAGLDRNQTHLEAVLQAVDAGGLQILELSAQEQDLARNLPRKLKAGECEAIALAKNRPAYLLSNDKRAVRYCNENGIKTLDLATVLNLLWTRRVISKNEVRGLIEKMIQRENLQFTPSQRARVFAPHRRHRRHKS